MLKHTILVTVLLITLVINGNAQDLITRELFPITAQNVMNLEKQATIGQGHIRELAISESRLAVATTTGIWIYNLIEAEQAELQAYYETEISTAAVALNGNLLAFATDQYVTILNIDSDDSIRQISSFEGTVPITFSNSGNYFIYGSNGSIKVMNMDSWEIIKELTHSDSKDITDAQFNSDGTSLLTISSTSLKQWSLPDMAELQSFSASDFDKFSGFTLAGFDSNDQIFVVGREAIAQDRVPSYCLFHALVSDITCGLNFAGAYATNHEQSKNGGIIVFGSGIFGESEVQVNLWNPTTSDFLTQINLGYGVLDIAIGQDLVAVATQNGTIYLWNLEFPSLEYSIDEAHISVNGFLPAVDDFAFSSSGVSIVTVSSLLSNAAVRSYDLKTGNIQFISNTPGDAVRHIIRNPIVDNYIISGRAYDAPPDWYHNIYFLNKSSQTLSTLRFASWYTTGVAISSDGNLGITTHRNGEIRLWNLESQTSQGILAQTANPVTSVVASPQSSPLLATGTIDGTVTIWNYEDSTSVSENVDRDNTILSLDFSPDGTQLAVLTVNGLYFLSVPDLQILAELENKLPITYYDISYNVTGDLLAVTSSYDEKSYIQIFDTNSLAELKSIVSTRGLYGEVAFSPDSLRLVVTNSDGTIQIFGIPINEE